MEKLNLKFKDSNLEKEYYHYERSLCFPFNLAALISLGFYLIFQLVDRNSSTLEITLSIVAAIACFLMIILHRMLKEIIQPATFLLVIGTSLYMLLSRDKIFEHLSNDSLFLFGYTWGFIHSFSQQSYSTIPYLFLIEVFFLVSKLAIQRHLKVQFLILYIFQFLLLLYVRIRRDQCSRTTFQKFQESRASLIKFSDILNHHLPSSLVIVTKSLTKTLFTNYSFRKSFHHMGEENEALEIFHKMKVEHEERPQDPDGITVPSTTGTNLSQHLTNLKDLLDRRTKRRSSLVGLYISASCSYNDPETENKILYEVKGFAIKWDGEDALAVLFNDISIQETLLSLKIANDNKEKAISTVSHELRNPVNGLLGMIQIMETQTKNTTLLKSISILKTNVHLLLNILNSILDLQQINANKLSLNITKVNVFEVLHNVQLLYEFQCFQKNLEFRLDLDDSIPPFILTDKNRLSQILINLAANALKFTFRGGITMGVREDPNDQNKLIFWVSDTGIGIKPEDQCKLFRMFGKIDNNGEINQEGVGLGLMISNSLVKVLNRNDENAHIQLESEPGVGTTFYFTLFKNYIEDNETRDYHELNSSSVAEEEIRITTEDIESPRKSKFFDDIRTSNAYYQDSARKTLLEDIKEESSKNDPMTPGAKYILVVDDNPFNLMITKQQIENRGYRCKIACNGEEVIKEVRDAMEKECSIQLILMDNEMPVMNGLEAAHILTNMKMNREIPDIPIIGLSGNDSQQIRQECLKAGMKDYLVKPLKDKDIDKLLRNVGA